MNAEKLSAETVRLTLELENALLNWSNFLRQGFLFLVFQIIVGFVLIYFFRDAFVPLILLIAATLLWKIGEGLRLLLAFKEAEKTLNIWRETVNLANETVE